MPCGIAVVASGVGQLNDGVVDKVTGTFTTDPGRRPTPPARRHRHL
jgi:hypothetical protein